MVTTANPNPPRRCKDKNRYGDSCGAYAVEGSEFCFWHDPSLLAEREAARAKGGKARHGRVLLLNNGESREAVHIGEVADVLELLDVAINDVLTLENSIARSRCLGYLVGVVTRTLESHELEERVAALEAALVGKVHQ